MKTSRVLSEALKPFLLKVPNRAVLKLSGKDTVSFLQGLLSQDMRRFDGPPLRINYTTSHIEDVLFRSEGRYRNSVESTSLTKCLPQNEGRRENKDRYLQSFEALKRSFCLSQALPTLLLSPKGNVYADALLFRLNSAHGISRFLEGDPDLSKKFSIPETSASSPPSMEYLLEVDAEHGDFLLKMLLKRRLRSKLQIDDISNEFSIYQLLKPNERFFPTPKEGNFIASKLNTVDEETRESFSSFNLEWFRSWCSSLEGIQEGMISHAASASDSFQPEDLHSPLCVRTTHPEPEREVDQQAQQVSLLNSSMKIIIAKDPRSLAIGFRLLIFKEGIDNFRKMIAPSTLLLDEDNYTPGEIAYKRARILCGISEGAAEVTFEKSIPFFYNFDFLGYLSLEKGCFVGQELIARVLNLQVVRRRMFVFRINSLSFPTEQPSDEKQEIKTEQLVKGDDTRKPSSFSEKVEKGFVSTFSHSFDSAEGLNSWQASDEDTLSWSLFGDEIPESFKQLSISPAPHQIQSKPIPTSSSCPKNNEIRHHENVENDKEFNKIIVDSKVDTASPPTSVSKRNIAVNKPELLSKLSNEPAVIIMFTRSLCEEGGKVGQHFSPKKTVRKDKGFEQRGTVVAFDANIGLCILRSPKLSLKQPGDYLKECEDIVSIPLYVTLQKNVDTINDGNLESLRSLQANSIPVRVFAVPYASLLSRNPV